MNSYQRQKAKYEARIKELEDTVHTLVYGDYLEKLELTNLITMRDKIYESAWFGEHSSDNKIEGIYSLILKENQ